MLPGIVFCMSRKHCVLGAHAVTSLNLLGLDAEAVRASRRMLKVMHGFGLGFGLGLGPSP